MKKALFVLLLLPFIALSQSTLVTWNTSITSNGTGITPATVSSGQYLNATAIKSQNVSYIANQYNGYQTTGWPEQGSFDDTKYVYFSISAFPNNTVTVNSIAFAYSGTAKKQKVQYILNGTPLTTYDNTTTDSQAQDWATKNFSQTLGTGITIPGGQTLVVRISAAQGNSRQISTITVNGSSTLPSPYAGSYHIGAAQPFPLNTITSAVNAINTYGVSAPVTFLLDDALYTNTTGETFPIVFTKVGGATAANNTSATKTITIKPAAGVSPTIKALNGYANNNTVYVPAVFILKSTDFVTFDGSNTTNGTTKNLTIINENSEYQSGRRAAIWVADYSNDAATNNTIKNTILKNTYDQGGSALVAGVYSGTYSLGGTSMAHINVTDTYVNNSNLTVTNNTFTNVKQGVVVNAGTGTATATNIVVTKNDMGSYAGSNTVRLFTGVYLKNVNTFEISENSIHDIYRTNTDYDSADIDTYTLAAGIHVTGATKNGTITKNQIKDVVRATAQNSYLLAGINLESSEASANIAITNNFVLNVKTNGGGASQQDAQGIAVVKGGNYKIYFNTVQMTGSQSNGGYSSAFYVGADAATALDVRNNIFVNSQTNTNTRRTAVRIIKAQDQVTATFSYLNYNNLYAPYYGYVGTGTNTGDNAGYQTSLPGWKSVLSGFEANATDVSPSFSSATDLHLTQDNATNAQLVGTPIATVSQDIDGQLRNFITPAIGADEYGVSPYTNTITCDNSTTWDGTAWSNGTPNATTNAIFKGSYTQDGGTLTACSVFVLNGATVSFTNNSTAKVIHSVNVETTGSLTFESSSVLYQTGDDANTGLVTVKRKSSMLKRLDYTIWSAPVFDARETGYQTLRQFSQMTSNGRFYYYKTDEGLFYTVPESTTKFAKASGYLIRMPNSNALEGYNAGTTRMSFEGVFTGTPNNGTLTKALDFATDHGFNMIGNPYPSPINVKAFINENLGNIDGTIWLWRKNNNAAQTTYCTVNLSGYVANTAPGGSSTDGNSLVLDPYQVDVENGSLNTAQGFFVKATGSNKQVTFKNSMRLINHSNTFFKSAAPQATEETADISRLWLNATNAAGDFDQMLVAYNPATTLGFDNGYDGNSLSSGNIALYSVAQIENDTLNFAIQARGSFNTADVVKLGMNVTAAGTYTISIDHSEGVFANGQIVYITDNVEGITRNLSQNSFTFTTEAGTFTDRFTVTYAPATSLGTDNPVAVPATEVIVYKSNKQIGITAPQTIKSVVVYDMLGRTLYTNAKVNATEFKTNEINTAQQVVVVNVTLENNQVVTKKIMMN